MCFDVLVMCFTTLSNPWRNLVCLTSPIPFICLFCIMFTCPELMLQLLVLLRPGISTPAHKNWKSRTMEFVISRLADRAELAVRQQRCIISRSLKSNFISDAFSDHQWQFFLCIKFRRRRHLLSWHKVIGGLGSQSSVFKRGRGGEFCWIRYFECPGTFNNLLVRK